MANISNFITPPGSGGGGSGGGAITYGDQLQALTLVVGAGGAGGAGEHPGNFNGGGGGGGGASIEGISIFEPGVRYNISIAASVPGKTATQLYTVGNGDDSYLDTYNGRIIAPGGGSGGSYNASSPRGGDGASGGGGGQLRGSLGGGGAAINSLQNFPITKGVTSNAAQGFYGLNGATPAIADSAGGGGSAFNPISNIISVANATTASVGKIVRGIDNNEHVVFGLGGTGNTVFTGIDLSRRRSQPQHREPLLGLYVAVAEAGPANSGWGGSGGGRVGQADGYASGGGVVIIRSTTVPNVYSDATTQVTTLNTGNYFQFTEGDDTVTVFKADGFIEFPTT